MCSPILWRWYRAVSLMSRDVALILALIHLGLGLFLLDVLTSGVDDGVAPLLQRLPSHLPISESILRIPAFPTPHNYRSGSPVRRYEGKKSRGRHCCTATYPGCRRPSGWDGQGSRICQALTCSGRLRHVPSSRDRRRGQSRRTVGGGLCHGPHFVGACIHHVANNDSTVLHLVRSCQNFGNPNVNPNGTYFIVQLGYENAETLQTPCDALGACFPPPLCGPRIPQLYRTFFSLLVEASATTLCAGDTANLLRVLAALGARSGHRFVEFEYISCTVCVC